MSDYCQVCHRPLGGPGGVAAAQEESLEFARDMGVKLEDSAHICVDCLQRYMNATSGLADLELLGAPPLDIRILAEAQQEVFVTDGIPPPGVFDLGHVSGYNHFFVRNFATEIVRAEFQATTLMKNLTLARRGDAIYHFRVHLASVGGALVLAASGSAGRTGKKSPALEAAWQLFDQLEDRGK